MSKHRSFWAAMVSLSLLVTLDAAGQDPSVALDPSIGCWANDDFPIASANVEPPEYAQSARLFFRCSAHVDYYFVELALESERYQSAMPKANDTCPSVIYYVEVIGEDFSAYRTEEIEASVGSRSSCSTSSKYFLGTPSIVLGTLSGATVLPPGFSAVGIASFIAAPGAAAGGIGAATVVTAGGVAAGATGVAVAATNDGPGSTTTTTTVAGKAPDPATPPTTSAPASAGGSPTTTTSTPPFNEAPRACMETDPISMTVEIGEPIRLDANCSEPDRTGGSGGDTIASYEWDLGDGRQKNGRLITAVYTSPGTYTVGLTVTDAGGASGDAQQDQTSEQIVVLPSLDACFQVQSGGGSCIMLFDASCSTGDIIAYDWFFEGNPPSFPDASRTIATATTSQGWDLDPDCFVFPSFVRRVSLTVRRGSGVANTVTQDVTISSGERRLSQKTMPTELTSQLWLETNEARGQISVDATELATTVAGTRHSHRFEAHEEGLHRIVATLTRAGGRPGRWEFDFAASAGFELGSVRVESGEILRVAGTRVVFRLRGEPGERISFTFRSGAGPKRND